MNIFGSPNVIVEDDALSTSTGRAKMWADLILDMKEWTVSDVDRPYVKAVLVAISLFEQPMKELSVSIIQTPERYTIHVTGYGQMHSFLETYRVFLDPSRRGRLLDPLEDVQWQPAKEANGIICSFIVKKTHLRTAQKDSDTTPLRRFRKRE